MMSRPRRFLPLVLISISAASAPAQPPALQRTAGSARDGTAAFVRVADAPLAFTGQVFSAAPAADVRVEAEQALDALGAVLGAAGSDARSIVRLAAYASDDAAMRAAEAVVATRFAGEPVALTRVRTSLTRPGARVAFEAVAASRRSAEAVVVSEAGSATLPAGGKIFISGQAEKGADLAAASRLTMAGLHRSLRHLGLAPSDVVQVKAFIRPFSDHAAAVRAMAESFGDRPAPPIVVMEWVSDLFAEIELVAAAKSLRAPAGETVTHAWLPWLVKSPRYCNVAFVPPGTPLIFVGAVDAADTTDPRAQMKAIFERIGSVLFEAGSSYRNLAKATYYLHAPQARALLGDIRGVYFDPTRPPAASALQVVAPARPSQAAAVDLVAVPVK